MTQRTGFLLAATLSIVFWRGPITTAAEKASSPRPQIGDKIEGLTFKDIRYLPRTLDEFGDVKAFVIVFTNLDCPLVKRYLPQVKGLDETYRDRGVQFLSINVGPHDSIVEIAYQAVKAGAAFPFCKDFSGDCVRKLGVGRTPEVVVLDSEKRLRYRGRIDSMYRLGGVRPDRGREDLKEAIEDVLAGREVRVPETPVDGCKITFEKLPATSKQVTWSEDIAPIMQKNCQDCHHEGTTAPFSLTDYKDASNYAEMIAEVVAERRMPPCYSSEEHGHFINRRSMSLDEVTTVQQWVKAGAPQGDPSKAPKPLNWPVSKWQIDDPDLVVTMGKSFAIPAEGYVPYKYAILPYRFPHDTWVEQVEILPGNRSAQHHCNLAYIMPGKGLNFGNAHFITGQVPGGQPMKMDKGVGFLIPKGAVLVLQIHYITNGEATSDRTSVGFVFPRHKIQQQLKHLQVADYKFKIPPGAPGYKVIAEQILKEDAIGIGMFSHMHLRGKDMMFDAIYPDGQVERLLAVPNYSFDWQMAYVWEPGEKRFPAGTKIRCTAHYDNSAFNPYNPDPKDEVKYGPQTYHEMLFGFFFYVDVDEHLNLSVDPKTGRPLTTPDAKQQAKN